MSAAMEEIGRNVVWLPRYTAQRIAFQDLWLDGGWAVKAYTIGPLGQTSDHAGVSAARRAFNAGLSWVARADKSDPRPNIGFVLLSAGPPPLILRMRFCWWADDGAALRTEVLGSTDSGRSSRFVSLRRGDTLADVNELRVIAFERDAWEALVLSGHASRTRKPNLEGYLAARLHDDF